MKNISLILASLLTFANAEMFGLSLGVGYEEQKIDGYVEANGAKNYFGKKTPNPPNQGYLGLDDEYNPYFYLKVIHPLPLVPNIKFQYTRYSSTGKSDYIAGGVEVFGDVKIPLALTNAYTKLDINSYDLTLFYQFNPLIADIEVGLGVDYFKGNIKITAKDPLSLVTKTWVDSDWSVPLPYVYVGIDSAEFNGFSIIANAKVAKLGDNHHYDYLGAIKYRFDLLGPVNPFITAGYRYKEAYGEDGDNTTKLSYKGIFLEIGAQF